MKKYNNIYGLSEKDQNICRHLYVQIDNLYKTAINKGVICKSTGYRYRDGLHTFARFLVECYHKINLNYIERKHIYAFAEQAWESGYSKSNIFTTLSAIRDFYDRTRGDGSSLYLPTNEMLKTELEEIGISPRNKIDRIGNQRVWTENEVKKMKEKAIELGHEKYAEIIELSRAYGLRIHEAVRLNTVQLTTANNEGKLFVKGKGGLVRGISIRNQRQKEIIDKLLYKCDKGKVFVSDDEKAHELIKKVQHFIYNHKTEVQESVEACRVFEQYCIKAGIDRIKGYDSSLERGEITAHGLRHSWALEYYLELRSNGMDDIAAKRIISRELGHYRVEVTKIYLKV